ncbi:hypothetical protein D083_3495 [Dickeya solani RNS 08.23.3.1.A]|nr:hypothetical protein D083_3495 [Dickeya solani RNS 08.23.3.1.A]
METAGVMDGQSPACRRQWRFTQPDVSGNENNKQGVAT